MLRLWREAAGVRTGDAAKAMGWTSERMSRIERGAYRVYEDDVRAFAALYEVTDEVAIREVTQVAAWTPDNAWWLPYEKRLEDHAADYFWLYSQAETIVAYHPTLPPGFLQEPDYARKLAATASDTTKSRVSPDEFVSLRMGMKSIFFGEARLKSFIGLVPEIALGVRDIFGPDTTRRQLQALANPPYHPGLQVRVVPTASAGHTLRGGAAILMTFRHPWPDAVVIESPPVVGPVGGSAHIGAVREWLDPVVQSALSPEESREMIEKYLTRCE